MTQDDYYYEIQLTNKQLVFYFLAGAIVLILAFLAGVWVGRSIENPNQEAQAPRPLREERIVAEETPKPTPSSSASSVPLTYAQRLESERPEESLARPQPTESASPKSTVPDKATADAAAASPKDGGKSPGGKDGAKPSKETAPAGPKKPAAKEPSPEPKTASPRPPAGVRPTGGTFTIQVGAFKDRAAAESLVKQLKAKGYSAHISATDGAAGGLFNVRVGPYPARADAERVQTKLRDEEKYKPFIVKQ